MNTETKPQHTPTLHIRRSGSFTKPSSYYIYRGTKNVAMGLTYDDAAFIVKAVNTYQPVINALKEAQNNYGDYLEALKVIEMVWQAIAKAL